MPPGSSQPRTINFAAGSTTTVPNVTATQPAATAYPQQPNPSTASVTTQPQTQPQQQQPPQQKVPAHLSPAQQLLQERRQQQQQKSMQQTQAQAPPTAASNQYSLKSRRKLIKRKRTLSKIFLFLAIQSRYVDVLASTKGAVAPTPNIQLNDLMPTPSSGVPTFAASNQTNSYFVPGGRSFEYSFLPSFDNKSA
jgi:hypothetical protein